MEHYLVRLWLLGFAVRNIALQHFLIDDSNQVKMVDLSQLVALEEMRSDLYGIAGKNEKETNDTNDTM